MKIDINTKNNIRFWIEILLDDDRHQLDDNQTATINIILSLLETIKKDKFKNWLKNKHVQKNK